MFGGTHEQKFASTLANFVHLSLSSYYTGKAAYRLFFDCLT